MPSHMSRMKMEINLILFHSHIALQIFVFNFQEKKYKLKGKENKVSSFSLRIGGKLKKIGRQHDNLSFFASLNM